FSSCLSLVTCHLSLYYIDRLAGLKVAGVNDYGIAQADAGENFYPVVAAPPRRDGLLYGFAVLHDDNFFYPCESCHGARWNGHGHASFAGHYVRARESSGAQSSIVADFGFDHEHAVLFRDSRTQANYSTRVDVSITFYAQANLLT